MKSGSPRLVCLLLALSLCLCVLPAHAQEQVTTLTCFINHSWYWTDTWEGLLPEEITARTGIRLDVTRAVDARQLGLMIASGDLPDIIYTADSLDILSNANLCYSYDELIAQYGLDWTPDKARIANALSFSSDEHYYTLLQSYSSAEGIAHSSSIPTVGSLCYRKDLLEELGNPPMTTVSEYMDVLAMVKEKYPDMIPMTMHLAYGLPYMRTWVGMSTGDFIEMDDGSVLYYTDHPKYFDFLKLVNGMVRDGYIIADNFAAQVTDQHNYIVNGQAFSSAYVTQGQAYRYNAQYQQTNPSAVMVENLPFTDMDGYYSRSEIGWSGAFISRNCQNPEAAIRFLQFLNSKEGMWLAVAGREGIEYTIGEDGMPVFSEEFLAASGDTNVYYTKYNPSFLFGIDGVVESECRCALLPAWYRAVYPEIAKKIKVEPWLTAAKPTGDSQEKIIFDKLDDMVNTYEVKCFLSASDEELEANYNTLMQNAQSIGVEKLESYMTERVAQMKPLYE